MREDLPEWLGKPPLRGTDEWKVWLAKWRRYAKAELRDTAADDPDYDYGLLTVEERWQVALRLQVQGQIEAGRQNGPVPMSLVLGRKVSDLDHAGVVAWQVGRSSRPFRTKPSPARSSGVISGRTRVAGASHTVSAMASSPASAARPPRPPGHRLTT